MRNGKPSLFWAHIEDYGIYYLIAIPLLYSLFFLSGGEPTPSSQTPGEVPFTCTAEVAAGC